MGRGATITAEQVNVIADAMKAEGIKPTSRAVRERLGNTGSMGTINKLLQHWKAGQGRQTTAPLVLPQALQKALLEFMDQELTATRLTLESDLAEQQQEATDLATENERQAEIIAAREEELEALAIEKAAAEGKAGQLSVDLDAVRDEAVRERQAAENARTDLAKALLRLEAMPRLENDLAAVRAELEKERAGRVKAEQAAAVSDAHREDLGARLADARARAEREEATASSNRDRADKLTAELSESRLAAQANEARAQAFEREATTATKEAEKSRAEAKTAGEVAAQLRGQLDAALQARKPEE